MTTVSHAARPFRTATVFMLSLALVAVGMVATAPQASAANYSLSGKVTLPANVDANAWRTVRVSALSADNSQSSTVSIQQDGTYSIPSIPAGSWRVRAYTSSATVNGTEYPAANLVSVFYPNALSHSDAALVAVSANKTGINMTMAAGRSISGKITLSGVTQADWMNSVWVSAMDSEGNTWNVDPDPSTGAYTLQGLPARSFNLEFRSNAYRLNGGTGEWFEPPLADRYYPNTYEYSARKQVSVVDGNRTGINGTLERTHTVSGTVTMPAGTDARVLPASDLSARGTNGFSTWVDLNATTGAYTFAAPAGSYEVFARPGGYRDDADNYVRPNLLETWYGNTAFASTSTKVTIGTANLSGRNIAVMAGRTISGTVTFPAGATVAEKSAAKVSAIDFATQSGSVYSSPVDPATGKYTITHLLPNSYSVRLENLSGSASPVWASQYYGGNSAVDVTPSNKSGINFAAGRVFTTAPTPGVQWYNGTAGLKAVPGTWAPVPATRTFQWYRENVAIAGATKDIYMLTDADRGKLIRVAVTGALTGYSTTTRNMTVRIPALEFATTYTPTISGTTKSGYTLTAIRGTWSPTATYSYQWYRSGTAISGATAKTYKLTTTDRGKTITVKVTGKRTGYTTVTKTSAGKSIPKVFTKTVTPTITGTLRSGYTVTAIRGTWSPTATYTYQWYRDGKAIKGATGKTRKLNTYDKGKKIQVKVTGKRSGYTTVTRTSGGRTVAN